VSAEEGDEHVRRLGVAHSVTNLAALGPAGPVAHGASARTPMPGVALSLLVNVVAGFSGFLGGRLAYVRGVGVED
jgi:hypothetical protein